MHEEKKKIWQSPDTERDANIDKMTVSHNMRVQGPHEKRNKQTNKKKNSENVLVCVAVLSAYLHECLA